MNDSPAACEPVAQSANGAKHASTLEWVRHLGGGYSAAWRIKHKPLHIMVQRESRRYLSHSGGW